MKLRGLTKWILAAIPFAIVFAAIVIYVEINSAPRGYSVPDLTPQQKDTVAETFINEKLVADFHNKASVNQPYQWEITEGQANHALASMDEIAYRLGSKKGIVNKALADLKLADPAVRFENDRMILMIRSLDLDKVLSAGLSFDFDSQGKMLIKIQSVRLGNMPVPASFVQQQIAALVKALPPPQKAIRSDSSLKSEDLAKLLAIVLQACNGEPIVPEINYPRPVRVENIKIEEGQIQLQLQPIRRAVSRPGKSATNHRSDE